MLFLANSALAGRRLLSGPSRRIFFFVTRGSLGSRPCPTWMRLGLGGAPSRLLASAFAGTLAPVVRAIAVVPLILVMMPLARAHAFRSFVDDPEVSYPARINSTELFWDASTVGLDESRLSGESLEAALVASLATLNANRCQLPLLRSSGINGDAAGPGDGRNTVSVVGDDWIGRGFPSGRGAFTDVQLERRADGVSIVEADIYLNFAAFVYVVQSAGAGELDLQAVLTHELLHSVGLLHNCELDGRSGTAACGPEHYDSAVYPLYLGEIARTPSADDLDGLCFLYPENDPTGCLITCDDGMDCFDGECIGVGDPHCGAERPCAEGVCAIEGDNFGYCTPEGATGSPCDMGADCRSNLCVSGPELAYCTVDCTDDAECPGMQRCAEVEGRSVCAPLDGGAGCSVGQTRSSVPSPLRVVGLIALFGLRSRRSRGTP